MDLRTVPTVCRLLDTNFLTGYLPDSWSANASSWPSLATMCVLAKHRSWCPVLLWHSCWVPPDMNSRA